MPLKERIRLIATETDNSRPEARPRPQNTPHGDHLGDQRVFTDELRAVGNNNQPTGPVLGEHGGVCTLVRIGPGNTRIYQCFATYALRDGLITARTLIDLSSGGPIKAAITGGTDKYDRAQGEITATFPAAKRSDFTLDLS